MMTPYQDLAERLITEMLLFYDAQTLKEQAFKLVAQTLIRHYPEFDQGNRKYYNKPQFYKERFQFTRRAWNQFQLDTDGLMYEHIWPIEATFNALIDAKSRSPITREAVHEIMKQTEIIILSSEEAALLNGSPSRMYQLDGRMLKGLGVKDNGTKAQRLAAIEAEIEPSTEHNSIAYTQNGG
jgi:hypothetical protein